MSIDSSKENIDNNMTINANRKVYNELLMYQATKNITENSQDVLQNSCLPSIIISTSHNRNQFPNQVSTANSSQSLTNTTTSHNATMTMSNEARQSIGQAFSESQTRAASLEINQIANPSSTITQTRIRDQPNRRDRYCQLDDENSCNNVPVHYDSSFACEMEASDDSVHFKKVDVSRPTSLSPNQVSLSAPMPPEFSISPADSVSKASSSEQMSSNALLSTGKCKPLHSPSSLSVNFCYNANNMVLSPSFVSLQSSLASSINDLTVEAEQFERAIRHNDTRFVSKMVSLYLTKYQSDKQSQTLKKSNQDLKTGRRTLKSQMAFDDQQTPNQNYSHQESSSTDDRECLSIFTNALHLAIENNAYDVTVLLLKNGIEPNQAGVAPYTIDFWRRSSQTSDDSNMPNPDRLNLNNLNMIPSASREPLIIRTPSIRTANSPMLLSPKTGPSFFVTPATNHLNSGLYFSVNSSPSSINSDLSSMAGSSNIKLIRLRPEMPESLCTVYKKNDGSAVFYDEEFSRERLFTLPPVFLAVALNNSVILRELIRFGANVNLADSHGVTPLHLCLCQDHFSRACLHLLVQSGAKLKAKNKQSIAPYELVDPELHDEVMYLQRFIIDEAFTQLLPAAKRKAKSLPPKHMMMQANYKCLQHIISDGHSNSTINLPSSPGMPFFSKEESVESCGSGPNLSRYFDSKTMNNPVGSADLTSQKKKVQIESNKQRKLSGKDVQICLDDINEQVSIETPSKESFWDQRNGKSNNTNTSNSNTLFFPTTFSNLMGHKRSFACDSASPSIKPLSSNLSQSSLQLSITKENQTSSQQSQPQQQPPSSHQHHQQTFGGSMGARIFGRRKSGDESIKNQSKLSLSRTNTQDESRMEEIPPAQSIESSLNVLCKMSSNIECVRFILFSLQQYLPEIISLNESHNTIFKLHTGLSNLFNRLFQAIVDNFTVCKELLTINLASQSLPVRIGKGKQSTGLNSKDQYADQKYSTVEMLRLKHEMSILLCGLLMCALQCLKGGQTFQYTSLLIVNLIIDSVICFEASMIPLNLNKLFSFDLENIQSNSATGKSAVNEKSDKHSSAIAAAATIGKHFRNLRLNDSLNFKQSFPSREDKIKHFNLDRKHKVSCDENSLSPKKSVSEQNKLVLWMKQVHFSPKLGQRKQLNVINKLLSNKNVKSPSEDSSNKLSHSSTGTAAALNKQTESNFDVCEINGVSGCKNFVSILIQEGLDLILNVLNNAITLHKRVTGSKQFCLPSQRSRECIYHCLQILSVRAILYASQSEDAQKRLINDGPLKVLIASIDSTHDPQLICLALQVIANLSINPCNHKKLIEADLIDCLMQLILPSDEWFYTNHSTKYAKFVKHQAARIMVYLGLEKRLRNKVYLFDLLEDIGLHSPQSESTEDNYITQTSLAPAVIYSSTCPKQLIGSSVEGLIQDLIKQVEDKIINGDDSLCIDPLNDEMFWTESNADARTIKDPPAIQVDMPSGTIADRRITNHPNCFFYLSTLPIALQPIIILRVLQHRMFGCISYWAWHSNAVSRASVASVSGSSLDFNRSRASSNASNANLEITNALKRNINFHCSNTSLSPGRIEKERQPSIKGILENRLTPQNSLPLSPGNLPKGVQMSNSLSTIGQVPYANKLPIHTPLQRLSLIDQQLQSHVQTIDSFPDSPNGSPTLNKKFRFSSLRRNRHSLSTDNSSLTTVQRINSVDAGERNEAFIIAFQRELQNLPKTDSTGGPYDNSSQAVLTNSLASIICEAFDRSRSPLKRPRSCSVPRITFENFSSTLLQLPGNQIEKSQMMTCSINSLIRSATSDVSCCNTLPMHNSGHSPSLSPIKVLTRNLNESPISCTSPGRSASRSGSRSGSAGQVMTESIIPNVHKAILKLLFDWVRLCPNDFRQVTFRQELISFLNRVSILGEHYRWLVEEIRVQAGIDDKENFTEPPSVDSLINNEYKKLKKLILNGQLPCSKEEAAVLAVIQLRIEETSPQSKQDNETRSSIGPCTMLSTAAMRKNSIIEEKLRPICEDVKESSTLESQSPMHRPPTNMSSSFDELEEDDQDTECLSKTDQSFMLSSPIHHHHQHQFSRLQASPVSDRTTSVNNSTSLLNQSPNQNFTLSRKTTSRLFHWMSSNWSNRDVNFFSSIDVRQCLPPIYHNTKNIAKTIKEQKRKLFHTSIYESEQQLKKLYIQTCKRLPAFGCHIFQVKELLHGKTNRRATRLLGICLERIVLLDSKTLLPAKVQPTTNLQQWRTGGGRAHDRLVLEFRATKWSFVTPSNGSLRAIGTVLWEIMQDLDQCFLDTLIAGRRQEPNSLEEGSQTKASSSDHYGFNKTMHFRDELQRLEALLHFPEEVAFRLGQIEHDLFYNVEPVHYIRQVTVELSPASDRECDPEHNGSNDAHPVGPDHLPKSFTVQELIERFNEVSSWITHIIISQPTHEMRKAILSCIMRVVQTCWNLGNFNSAVEILAGLKSEKLKPFWLSIEEKDEPFLRRKLTHILLTLEEPSDEYKFAVIRALDIPHSKVIPFFGAFLRDLKNILQRMPSLIVLSTDQLFQQSTDTQTQTTVTKLESISEFNGEDNYMSRIGVGGIINIDKMYKTHQVLDNIRTFHIHEIRRNQLLSEMKLASTSHNYLVHQESNISNHLYYQLCCDQIIENELSKMENDKTAHVSADTNCQSNNNKRPSLQRGCSGEDDKLYQIDLESFKPIQPMPKSHGISLIPLDIHSIDYHNLQAMHHGMTTIHHEEDTGRSSMVYLQLAESNSCLAWGKPFWSTSLRSSGNTPQDYQLASDIENIVLPAITMKYETKEAAMMGLDEGFIDLMFLKDVIVGQTNADLAAIARRHCLPEYNLTESSSCSIKLLFGINLSDNRIIEFIAPKCIATKWTKGLRNVLHLIQKQKHLCDQRILWLKEKYLQLYYEEAVCIGPTPAEAIRVFGGRKWTIDAMSASHQSLQMDSLSNKHTSSSSKLRKKKSTVSLAVIRDYSTRSQISINSDLEGMQANNGSRSHQPSPQNSAKSSTYKASTSRFQVTGQSEPTNETINNSSDSISVQSSSSYEMSKSTIEPSVIHTSLLTSQYKEKFCKKIQSISPETIPSSKLQTSKYSPVSGSQAQTPKHKMAITHSSNMNFMEFSELFRTFLICIRRDIKDIFEQIASKSDIHTFKEIFNEPTIDEAGQQPSSVKREGSKKKIKNNTFLGLITRNTEGEQTEEDFRKSRIFDAIATASVVTNSAGVDTLKTSILTAADFHTFIITYQCEDISLEDAIQLIEQHESDPILRKRNCLSFEGFARYLMDKNNFAYTPELNQTVEDDMSYPLSHYYIASSHNTYLTGHQLKGESSVELYSQVLLTGCRCVELDCWDGDDGMPLIYHGHTLTSKIPFKKVVEAINEKAFVASPYPVILSVENHCSLQQQAKMAQIFLSVFGEKLVTKFLFESDYAEEPQLPSPEQLKYRILIKNKKLRAPFYPYLNLKMRGNSATNKMTNGRANSLISNVSAGSLNEDEDDEYDDEDDEEEVEESLQSSNIILESALDKKADDSDAITSKSKTSNLLSKQKNHSDYYSSSQDTQDAHTVSNSPFVHSKVVRKSSSQIAPELSDLVIYCQAIKFRGLLNSAFNLSPTSSAMGTPISKKASRKVLSNATFNSTIQASTSFLPLIESNKIKEELRELSSLSPTFQHTSMSNVNLPLNKRPNSSASCYQVSSINENTAKKLCRKTPLTVIAHTVNQIMRTYPAGMRIDSSNFNPVIFWAFGIQSVALNYQTVDTALHINSAMFEQNNRCGYVLKTNVMRDRSHMMFGRFNPWEKEFDGLHTINLSISIISGQYVCPNTNTGSPQIEVEIIGIPVDCSRQRTKIVQRNSLNPIWNDNFFFKIKFVDLAFLRVSVTDIGANHLSAQRIIPVKCLKQGYRHLRLHNSQNQSLPLSTLFLYSSYEEEGLDIESESDKSSVEKLKAKNKMLSIIDLNRLDNNKVDVIGTAPIKRRMFFLVVHGVMSEEPSTILKITQGSTVTDVITQALTKANKSQENVNEYVLLEEVTRGWEKKRIGDRSNLTQRILEPTERPLEAQSNWKGEGRFILKKLADDPSTRAWMTTIRSSSANKERSKRQDQSCIVSSEEIITDWEDIPENETFLVCIYNVSEDQPYTILKASVSSLAQDIISQALLKAHRIEDSKNFVIVEEVENFCESNQNELSSSFTFKSKPGMGYRRVVGDNENIYDVQTQWKNKGKFELKYRKDITVNDNTFIKNSSPSTSRLLRGRGSLKKLSQFHRTYSKRLQRKDNMESPTRLRKPPVQQQPVSSNQTQQLPQPPSQDSPQFDSGATTSANKNGVPETEESRQTHSEGELPSDSEEKSKDPISSLSRLKKLSLKRLKVWKS